MNIFIILRPWEACRAKAGWPSSVPPPTLWRGALLRPWGPSPVSSLPRGGGCALLRPWEAFRAKAGGVCTHSGPKPVPLPGGWGCTFKALGSIWVQSRGAVPRSPGGEVHFKALGSIQGQSRWAFLSVHF